jgi:excisionase family DNA binding protein
MMSKRLTHAIREEEKAVEKPSPVSEELLTVREVAQALRVDDTTTRRWIKSGALEAVSLPHVGLRCAYRIRRSTLDTLLNQPAHVPAHAPEPVHVRTLHHTHNHA